MPATQFFINDVEIKRPFKFSISRYNLTKSDRLGNGDMTMEIKSKKRKFFFTYDTIDSVAKNAILALIWDGTNPWKKLTYIEDDVTYTCDQCYVGEIPAELIRTGMTGGKWYWKDFNFNLIEK